ncbi:hypothetical protein [Paraburkholderia phenoliruptrix]|uniref:hypothetical protein n=1 Tax=Paraburkholderia phenoliruptrix TaxID=252970 RepID=UPI001C6ECC80|nr:hypothetical protein [Paraburkholderia phenoliruptrix]MBW9104757.1 hypothetical protein [Paraburkholderia phenoliruptrix]MBW9130475.1 hypothetical protein [Paraburkholderia ginsengiterrae]
MLLVLLMLFAADLRGRDVAVHGSDSISCAELQESADCNQGHLPRAHHNAPKLHANEKTARGGLFAATGADTRFAAATCDAMHGARRSSVLASSCIDFFCDAARPRCATLPFTSWVAGYVPRIGHSKTRPRFDRHSPCLVG